MTERPTVGISSRKQPRQARSNELVQAILQAAVQVLAEEGAQRFTTARVAERAGVSIGSLYQYFPNKASILFRLQSDEWKETTDLLVRILDDRTQPPLQRLRDLVHAFIRSECEEATVRVALDDAAPLYRDAPEARAAKEAGDPIFERFLLEVLPSSSAAARQTAADLILTTMSTVGKEFSETPRNQAEIEAYADAMADMFCTYIGGMTDKGAS
ncbi:TetR family transcriptional regulator [Shinella sp. M27]|uniref:TetR family transcriptional regulator n=1 Tax=Shinella sp. M27 TaxID=3368614 RepID=UPI003B9F57DC